MHFDRENLSDESRQFVCSSALIEQNFTNLGLQRNQRYAYSYIGSSDGTFRYHPSNWAYDFGNDNCVDYDPRLRPWYAAAVTGPKNIVFMIDISATLGADKLVISK